jgi:hypothetical protein
MSGMTNEEQIYLEALINTCTDNVTNSLEAVNSLKTSEDDEEAAEAQKTERTTLKWPYFKDSLRNVTRQEDTLQVSIKKKRAKKLFLTSRLRCGTWSGH